MVSQRQNDSIGNNEDDNVIYTLGVFVPDKPPRRLHRSLFRKPESSDEPLTLEHIPSMKRKMVKVKAYQFKEPFRCTHARSSPNRTCDRGCYVMERGGEGLEKC
jgi:hypothetical protein